MFWIWRFGQMDTIPKTQEDEPESRVDRYCDNQPLLAPGWSPSYPKRPSSHRLCSEVSRLIKTHMTTSLIILAAVVAFVLYCWKTM